MKDDSIDGIFITKRLCFNIKWAGGIGLHLHNVRAGVVKSLEQMVFQMD